MQIPNDFQIELTLWSISDTYTHRVIDRLFQWISSRMVTDTLGCKLITLRDTLIILEKLVQISELKRFGSALKVQQFEPLRFIPNRVMSFAPN